MALFREYIDLSAAASKVASHTKKKKKKKSRSKKFFRKGLWLFVFCGLVFFRRTNFRRPPPISDLHLVEKRFALTVSFFATSDGGVVGTRRGADPASACGGQEKEAAKEEG
jgi:hypothetical protein